MKSPCFVALWAAWLGLAPGPSGLGVAFPVDPVPIKHWGTDEGLSPGAIRAIIQSRDGYLWFGSSEGLARFDGTRCVVYDSRNTLELRANTISALYEDGESRLWVGTSGGGVVCRLPDGQFMGYGRDEGLSNEQVSAIAADESGRLWVGTDGGGLFQLVDGRFRAFPGNAELPSPFILALAPAGSDDVWVGSRLGLCRVNRNGIRLVVDTEGAGLSDSIAILPDGPDTLWIGGREGLYRFEHGQLTRVGTEEDVHGVQALGLGERNGLWIGTIAGLIRYEEGRFTRLTTDQGLSGNLIATVFLDHEECVWVGSDAPGVDQIRFTKFAFLSTQQGLSHPISTGVCEDREGALWIGSHQGVNRYANGQVTYWTERDGLSANLVFTVCEDPVEGIWIGTRNGLNHFVGDKFRVYTTRDGLPSNVIWCLYRDRSDVLWAGTRRGLVRVGPGGIEVFNDENSGLSHQDVRVIGEDRDGRLWVGTSYGLNRREGNRFVNYVNSGPDRPLNVVLALHGDADGDLWIGTMGQGLLRFREERFDSFTREDGLYDDVVYQILEDDGGALWISCGRGVYQVPKSRLIEYAEGRTARIECSVYGKSDGLLSTECNGTIQPAGWKARDGRLWFPTTKGVAVVDPQRLPHNPLAPLVAVEQVTVNGEAVSHSDGMRIGPWVERIEFQFTALSYVAPELVRFRYRLEGLDREWMESTSERVARYTHPPPGEYAFRVTACNNDGVWNTTGATVAFSVVPAWWQTPWLLGGAGVAFTGVIGALARGMTVRRYRRRMAVLEHQHALERERTRIARDMHDGLGSNLVKISMLGEIVEAGLNDPERIRREVEQIGRTARTAVRDMDEIVWAVNPKNDTVENLANYLCHFAREHFEFAPNRLHLDVPPNLPSHALSAEARHNLFLAVKEALNNAVKHSQAKDVWLRLHVEGSRLEITVEDNGRGLPATARDSSGSGMANLRTRATQLGAALELSSRPSEGTRVVFRFDLE